MANDGNIKRYTAEETQPLGAQSGSETYYTGTTP